MTVPGLTHVHSRIAALQSRIAALAPAVPQRYSTASGAGSATSTTFAATFQEVLTGGGTSASAGRSPAGLSGSFPAPVGIGGAAELRTSAGAPNRASPAPGRGTATAPTGSNVLDVARRYLGVPYLWGGEDPKKGLDCSALVERVYQEFGIDLPRVSRDQARSGRPVPGMSAARPGDLLFFGSPVDHVAIYAGDGRMLHAPRTGRVVSVDEVYATPVAIRRLLPDAAAAPPVAKSPASDARARAGHGGLRPGLPYGELFRAAAGEHGVSAALLAGVAKVESGYSARAVSPAGARGLMQLMPATARELGVNPLDPAQAVDGAARLLKAHLRTFGSVELALAAYNAGPGAVRRFDGIPPYAETRAYVPKVLKAMAEARA